MDITQLYIQQQFGEGVKPRYGQTEVIRAVPVLGQNVVAADFINEKVKVILCTGLWISYNTVISPVVITDMFNKVVFETPVAPAVLNQVSGMFFFDYVQEGAAIKFSANNVNFKFSLFFRKVYFYNEKA